MRVWRALLRKPAHAHDHLIMPVVAQLDEALIKGLITAVHNGSERIFHGTLDIRVVEVHFGLVFEFHFLGAFKRALLGRRLRRSSPAALRQGRAGESREQERRHRARKPVLCDKVCRHSRSLRATFTVGPGGSLPWAAPLIGIFAEILSPFKGHFAGGVRIGADVDEIVEFIY